MENFTAVAGKRRVFARPSKRFTLEGLKDMAFERSALLFALIVLSLIVWIGVKLYLDCQLTRERYGFSMLTGTVWDVPHEVYGALPYIFGTVVSSVLALVIAVPLGVGAALFLSEVAPRKLATPIAYVIELLAAIPSVIFGLCGFLVLCPFLQAHVSPWIAANLGANPIFAGPPFLTNMLAAGVILAIMVLPVITSISREVLRTVPTLQREGSMALGATKWETIWRIVLPEAKAGIVGAVILGLGRALGETMAVVMVVGNTPKIVASILQSGYTMPALLANEFNEAFNDEVHRSALLEIALILFVVTVLVNAFARLVLLLTQRPTQPEDDDRKGRVLKGLRSLADKGAPFVFGGFTALLLGVQFFVDIKAYGVAGLFRPVELATFLAVLASLVVSRIKGTLLGSKWRRFSSIVMQSVLALLAFGACFVLGALLFYVIARGAKGLNLNLFTELPRPAGIPGGGIKNAILGTFTVVGIASVIGIPLGLLGGVYVAHFGSKRLGSTVRFSADVLNGIPSVVIGLFAYAAFVLPVKHFSAWAGGAALAIIMVPTILRTTEEMLRLVPNTYLEGALALGATRAQAIRSVVIPAAKSGIVTGLMLAIARVSGETAPLLFTAFGSDQMAKSPAEAVSALTLKIYQYAISPYNDWVDQAWAGALVLMVIILVISSVARFAVRNRFAAS